MDDNRKQRADITIGRADVIHATHRPTNCTFYYASTTPELHRLSLIIILSLATGDVFQGAFELIPRHVPLSTSWFAWIVQATKAIWALQPAASADWAILHLNTPVAANERGTLSVSVEAWSDTDNPQTSEE